MENDLQAWNHVLVIIATVWLVLVVGFGIYFWIRVMPGIRELRKTVEGERLLVKALFPPRFHK
jgi:hypothetical protein